ncbi:MAG: oxygen-dependent coproporphyrinogen oxidase [Acidimicrobiia bacterium]
MDRTSIEAWYRGFQERFCAAVETAEPDQRFGIDDWERPGGGGGRTRILAGGSVIEKAACNFSAVWGTTPPKMTERMAGIGTEFFATGVSIIVHPRNPYAPTFHANVRYFESKNAEGAVTAWFGGGGDLTPYYLFEEDAKHFHSVLRASCDRHEVADYAGWKRECDEYFYLHHRKETRGVGGLFFDHLTERMDETWAFQQDLADSLAPAYVPLVQRRCETPYGEHEVEWHEIRRGRYVEFNLVWDVGTKFGLETDGRTESILGSMPPRARWEYCYEPEPGSAEAALLSLVRGTPRDWA